MSKKLIKLDLEEQELSDALDDALDNHALKSVDNLKEEILLAQKAADKYLRKDTRVNIRISSSDLERIKQKAAYKGLPYQTFIASVLHEYAAGHFQDSA
ncbi:MAG: hypothetical protein CMF39_03250 [Legionellaceae bacterium]|mgnify:CR=1 FL=1|nr:hypothetical protein [Legionellaceae bacterium]